MCVCGAVQCSALFATSVEKERSDAVVYAWVAWWDGAVFATHQDALVDLPATCLALAAWQFARYQEKAALKAQIDARRAHVLRNADIMYVQQRRRRSVVLAVYALLSLC